MKFVTSMTPFVGSLAFASPAQLGVDQARQLPGPSDLPALDGITLEEPWEKLLERQKLSPRLQDFLTYAICLWDWSGPCASGSSGLSGEARGGRGGRGLTVGDGLRCLGRFVSSLGMYGRGTGMPLLYPMYGVAEMAQGFTRMCALHRGTYALRTSITKLLAERDSSEEATEDTWRLAGVVTDRGEVIRTRCVITSPDHLSQKGIATSGNESSDERCARLTAILDCPLLGEEGLNLCVVPPTSFEPPLANVVQVLQLDWTTGTCPKGYVVAHLSQARRATEDVAAVADADSLFCDLERVLKALLSKLDGLHHCLLSCRYLHTTRNCCRWDSSTPDGQVLASCAAKHGLLVCSDPHAVPQLLCGHEVDEAKTVFLQASAYDAGGRPGLDDFLKKPTHVALEEQCWGMQELEQFNEQMLDAERGPSPLPGPPVLVPDMPGALLEGEGELGVANSTEGERSRQ